MEAAGFFVLLAMVVAYFIPAIIAFARSHHNSSAILAMNFLLGWTGLGWAGALIWAVTKVEAQ